jgi:hypothetical protein
VGGGERLRRGAVLSPLPGAEVCEEYVWLVSNGLSVPLACEALGKTLYAMDRQLWRYGYTDYTARLAVEIRLERTLANERKRISA